jgi:hypothetical protein
VRTVGWLAVWVFVAGLVVLPHIRTFTMLSPIDEYQHIDYLANIIDRSPVHGGDQVGETAMREQACRGIDLPGFDLPRCGAADLTPEQFPGSGYNHTYNDPPTYYLITAPLAVAVQHLPGVDSIVTAARGIGVLWLGLGLALTFFLALRVGADRMSAFGATALVASSGAVVEASATVTTDAPALVVGGWLCLVAVAVVQGRVSWWWLCPAAAFAMLVKTTSFPVVGLVVVFLLIYLIAARREGTRRGPHRSVVSTEDGPALATHRRELRELESDGARLEQGTAGAVLTESREGGAVSPQTLWKGLVAVALAGAIPILLWVLYVRTTSNASADEIPAFQMFYRDSIGWNELVAESLSMTKVLTGAYVPSFLNTGMVTQLATLVNGLLVVGVAATAWFGRWERTSTRLAAATLVSMLVSGVGFTVVFFLGAHIYGGIPGRYGLCLIPAATAALAVAASRRPWGGKVLAGCAAVSMGVLLSHTL